MREFATIPRIPTTSPSSSCGLFCAMKTTLIQSAAEVGTPLPIFRALPGDHATRDAQDLMAYPFFSLAKTKRTVPIDFHTKGVSLRVEGTHEHGIATIWDADVLIWAASQIIEARDQGLPTSRLMVATPYEILRFVGRGTDNHNYDRLKAALDRLQSTTIATSIRQAAARRQHRFSWINEWKEQANAAGRADGISLILPDWFYTGLLDSSLVLTLDPIYFTLTGGIERWLYRLVRKHAGRQAGGWRFEFAHLHAKSGSVMRASDFAFYLRRIATTQGLPGYELHVERHHNGREVLNFRRRSRAPIELTIRVLAQRMRMGKSCE
jgi:plasmid replication initiation protein